MTEPSPGPTPIYPFWEASITGPLGKPLDFLREPVEWSDMRFAIPQVARFELLGGPFYTDVDDAYGAPLISEVPFLYTIPAASQWR